MLSKYNLKVGNIYDSSGHNPGEYTSSDTGYGLQSSEVRGYVSEQTRYGTVVFSATNYWYDGSALKPEYGSSYPADVYDPVNYKTEPDFSTTCDNSTNCYYTPGYSVAYYVEAYKDILSSYGTTIKEARLLTYAEATDSSIGCDASDYICPTNGFITNTSFWLGSAVSSSRVWVVISDGGFLDYGSLGKDIYVGVRPVIVVEKSNL
jgi:hypothetical protein